MLTKKHLPTEGALGRSAAVSSRNRRTTISASFSGVGLWESDLSSRRSAGGATGASEARPVANERRKKTPPRSSDEVDREPPARRSGLCVVKTRGSSIVRLREETPSSGRRTRDRKISRVGDAISSEANEARVLVIEKSMAEADRTHHAGGTLDRRKAVRGEAR